MGADAKMLSSNHVTGSKELCKLVSLCALFPSSVAEGINITYLTNLLWELVYTVFEQCLARGVL